MRIIMVGQKGAGGMRVPGTYYWEGEGGGGA